MRGCAPTPRRLAALKHYFRRNIADFICEYGTTYDPRLISEGKKPLVPFVLFDKQRRLVEFILERLAKKQHGLVAKGRDVGATATGVATQLSLSMLEDRFAAGVGAARRIKSDLTGAPDTIFAHADNFLAGVPDEFKGDVTRLYMRLNFGNGSSFVGEAGNECGRGGRKAVYLMDEYAFHPFPMSVDGALSHNTNTVLWGLDLQRPARPVLRQIQQQGDSEIRYHVARPARPRRSVVPGDEGAHRPVIFAQEVDANPLRLTRRSGDPGAVGTIGRGVAQKARHHAEG